MTAPLTEMTGETSLTIRRTFAAGMETLFKALTTPEAWLQWFGGHGTRPEEASADLRAGGAWVIRLRGVDSGDIFEVSGAFTEVDPPRRVSFTWAWSMTPDRVSQVTYTLSPATGGGTTLTLTHERLADTAARDLHAEGWSASLDKLDAAVAGKE